MIDLGAANARGGLMLADMLLALARSYNRHGSDYQAASAAYARRLEILRALPTPAPKAEAITLHDMAVVCHAHAGHSIGAADLYREAERRWREAQPLDPRSRALRSR
jgi:hypothetical protein